MQAKIGVTANPGKSRSCRSERFAIKVRAIEIHDHAICLPALPSLLTLNGNFDSKPPAASPRQQDESARLEELLTGDRHCQMVQRPKRLCFIQPMPAVRTFFVHISAVERSGMNGLNEGQKSSTKSPRTAAPASPRQTSFQLPDFGNSH